MNMSKAAKGLNVVKAAIEKHSPAILIGVGIAGAVSAVIFAVKATPKALKAIEDAQAEKGTELTKIETVKATWKYYIPAGTALITGVLCILGAHRIDIGRNAALMSACTLTSDAFKEYREKNIKLFGEKADDAVSTEIAKDKIANKPVDETRLIAKPAGAIPVYDPYRNYTYISYSMQDLELAVERLNTAMAAGEDYVSLNDFYRMLGEDDIKLGDIVGWHISSGKISLSKNTTVMGPNNVPSYVLTFKTDPYVGFDEGHVYYQNVYNMAM